MALGLRKQDRIFEPFQRGYALLANFVNIPTDALIDLLLGILESETVLTANDVAEMQEIQRELQKRGDEQHRRSQLLN